MKKILVILLLFLVSNIYSDEKDLIVLYEKPLIDGIPVIINPYAEGECFDIGKPEIIDGDNIRLDFSKSDTEDICIVLFFRAEDEFLVVYITQDSCFTIHSGGCVLFGFTGHDTAMADTGGTLDYNVTTYVWNQYNLSGMSGDLYVFAVKGGINMYYLMPLEQTDPDQFRTSSNVGKISFSF